MPAGTYTYTPMHTAQQAYHYNTHKSFYQGGRFNRAVLLRSIYLQTYPGYSGWVNVIPYVYQGSTLIATGTQLNKTISGNYEMVFPTPVSLAANTSYRIGAYFPYSDVIYPTGFANESSEHAHNSSPAFFTWTNDRNSLYAGGDASPGAVATNYELMIGFSVDIGAPDPATNLAVTNSPLLPGQSANASWQHNGGTQTGYKLKWRNV